MSETGILGEPGSCDECLSEPRFDKQCACDRLADTLPDFTPDDPTTVQQYELADRMVAARFSAQMHSLMDGIDDYSPEERNPVRLRTLVHWAAPLAVYVGVVGYVISRWYLVTYNKTLLPGFAFSYDYLPTISVLADWVMFPIGVLLCFGPLWGLTLGRETPSAKAIGLQVLRALQGVNGTIRLRSLIATKRIMTAPPWIGVSTFTQWSRRSRRVLKLRWGVWRTTAKLHTSLARVVGPIHYLTLLVTESESLTGYLAVGLFAALNLTLLMAARDRLNGIHRTAELFFFVAEAGILICLIAIAIGAIRSELSKEGRRLQRAMAYAILPAAIALMGLAVVDSLAISSAHVAYRQAPPITVTTVANRRYVGAWLRTPSSPDIFLRYADGSVDRVMSSQVESTKIESAAPLPR